MTKTSNINDFKNKKIAFVLSGGVVKAAAWHLGVAHALEDLGFTFKNDRAINNLCNDLEISTFVGSSAGAMVGIFLAEGYSPQDIINSTLAHKNSTLKSLSYKDMFFLGKNKIHPKKGEYVDHLEEFPFVFRQILKPFLGFSGFFSTEGVRQYLLKNVVTHDQFEKYKADLFIVATQLDHSRKVIFSKYNYPSPAHDNTSTYYTGANVAEAAAASMSVPPFYSPYPIKNKLTNEVDYYIDGEIRETLSTHVAEDNGCEIIISSWTHTPYHYHEEVGSLVNYGLTSIAIQSIYLMIQKKIVAARDKRASAIDIMDTVHNYMTQEKFTTEQRRNIMSILQRKLSVNPKVKLIDIYPDHHDYKLFFSNSFSLNPKTASHAVQAGYKKTIEVFGQL